MARATIYQPTKDVVSDGGAVLWSIVKGEQLEFEVELEFLDNATAFTYEAVLVEALNVEGQEEPPTSMLPGGVQTNVPFRLPVISGVWNELTAYTTGDIVQYNSEYFIKIAPGAAIDSIVPSLSPDWATTNVNLIYLQFLKEFCSTWSFQPTVSTPAYGYFELRVTEPGGASFQRTWKPVRGMVQFLFSPTDIVPDI